MKKLKNKYSKIRHLRVTSSDGMSLGHFTYDRARRVWAVLRDGVAYAMSEIDVHGALMSMNIDRTRAWEKIKKTAAARGMSQSLTTDWA